MGSVKMKGFFPSPDFFGGFLGAWVFALKDEEGGSLWGVSFLNLNL